VELEPHDCTLDPWRTLLIAQAVVLDAIEAQLRDEGQLPLAWFEVLARLSSTEGGAVRMQNLADRLVLSRSGVTRLVDRIEAAGLIERASCPSDRRGTFAVLTDAGRRAFTDAHPIVDRAVEEHFARHLDPSETRLLGSILAKLLDAHGYAVDRAGPCALSEQAPAERVSIQH